MSIALDLIIGVPILINILLGFRDGLVRKGVSLVMMLVALVLGQLFMHDLGTVLVKNNLANPEGAASRGFYCIFFGIGIIQAILYRLLTGNYKIGGIMDRIAGSVVGFVFGVIFMSTMLMMFALSGFPNREMTRESEFYRPIVNIAPEILDLTSSISTETMQKIKKINSSDSDEDTIKDLKSIHTKK